MFNEPSMARFFWLFFIGTEMLDINYIKDNAELMARTARDKRIDLDVERLLTLRAGLEQYEREEVELRRERNRLKELAKAHAHRQAQPNMAKDVERVVEVDLDQNTDVRAAMASDSDRQAAREINVRLKKIEEERHEALIEYERLMLMVPNPVLPEVPVGADDTDNVELYKRGEIPQRDYRMLDHIELANKLDIVNWEGARQVGGSRAYALKGRGVLLEMAVLRLAIDLLTARGFTLYAPPVMVRSETMTGTGYFPLGEENAYALERDPLYLTGTAEVGLVGMQAGRTFDVADLPLKLCGISPCFRREAGAAGRDTRGLYRVHQFQKVEQVVLAPPDLDTAMRLHHELLQNAEDVLEALELPYRVVAVCTGDIGQGQIYKHDIETWMPGRKAYGETHSCSLLGDFQARRLKLRVTCEDGAKRYLYTLNNTAAATPRLLIPLLENHQRADGAVYIPKALRPYLGGIAALEPV